MNTQPLHVRAIHAFLGLPFEKQFRVATLALVASVLLGRTFQLQLDLYGGTLAFTFLAAILALSWAAHAFVAFVAVARELWRAARRSSIRHGEPPEAGRPTTRALEFAVLGAVPSLFLVLTSAIHGPELAYLALHHSAFERALDSEPVRAPGGPSAPFEYVERGSSSTTIGVGVVHLGAYLTFVHAPSSPARPDVREVAHVFGPWYARYTPFD